MTTINAVDHPILDIVKDGSMAQYLRTLALRDFENPNGFQAWLEDQDLNATVGWTDDGCNNPLGRYLVALGLVSSKVGERTYCESQRVGEEKPLPKWAVYFLYELKRLHSGKLVNVTARVARGALNIVLA
jgi:hypothetical protein